ncbi:MAG: tRNA (adenosine(37)-N6)-threonylcarbamoyltransferase complex dimerization subunit type 1 TsaB [Bdellovibrionota bacterium]
MELLHLAIDTSTSRPAAAILKGETPLHSWLGPEGVRHHETLLAGVNECLEKSGFQLSDLGYLTVGVGPGMFTGLRIGITTAKFLADPLGIPCVAVSSLLALAHQSQKLELETVWAVSDAKAKRVYALRLAPGLIPPDWSAPAGEEIASTPEETASLMQAGDLLLGEGALLYREFWPKGIKLAPDHSLSAASVGILGAKRYALGYTSNANDLQPTYLKTGQGPL